ncbi:MAG TPA: MazG nucleotide pyrophosphohydrolase domain-containing protein, partial [Anaeromyxobacteraceae bacterium]
GGARAKVDEELRELDAAVAAGDRQAIEQELGDVLFAVANVARKLSIAPEEALRGTIARFIDRFEHVERGLERSGIQHGEATLEQMDELWNEAKALALQNQKTT